MAEEPEGRTMQDQQEDLLRWLMRDDGRYGECHGKALDALMAAGHVQWLDGSPHNHYGWVTLTESGIKLGRELIAKDNAT